MSENLKIWEAVRAVPDHAKKPIQGGRLKGMTDINPCWRLKTLTDQFGVCGKGWRYNINRIWTEPGNGGEVIANVLVDLYVVIDGVESAAIQGLGGSMLVVKEKNGLYTDDEAFKKAMTDAIGNACKALGIGADVYWDKDATKYTQRAKTAEKAPQPPKPLICADCENPITEITGKSGDPISPESLKNISMKKYGVQLCATCQAKRKAVKEIENA